jgi:mevalonyl-CoA ligase
MLVAPIGFSFYDYSTLFPKLDKEIPALKRFIVTEDVGGKYPFQLPGDAPKYVPYEQYINQYRANAKALPKQTLSCHDMVNVEFTSGSTGLPKNVALSHYNIMNCGRFIWQQVRMTDEDVICLPVPLFHSFGICVGKWRAHLHVRGDS